MQKVGATLPGFKLAIGESVIGNRAHDFSAFQGRDYVHLPLQRVDTAEVNILVDGKQKPLWKGVVPIPTALTYDLPIPTAALFGTQKLVLAVSEAGLITQIEYAKNTGLAGATNAANSVVGALTPESATARASDIKAQADVLAQQARLHRCLANPNTCQ